MKAKYYKSYVDGRLFEVARWNGKSFLYVYLNTISIASINHGELQHTEYIPTTKKVFDQFLASTMERINKALNK